jgi:asparagine synthase (glutamine-hydrolysing)
MSVQAGVWNFDGAPADPEVLDKISRQVAEYAPDGEEIFINGSVGMLYRPFHTTPQSRLEHQPLTLGSGKVITWDGRLDNRDELLPLLGNDLSADRTDVAFVAAAFDQWGTGCLSRLVGDWALSVWDPWERELILARDYLGVNQLFYYPKAGQILWCSHLGPLVLCGNRFTLYDDYIAGYLAFFPDSHLTPFAEIRSVPPAAFVRIRGSKITVETYWKHPPRFKTWYKTDAEYEEHYRFLLRQSIRRRLRTDGPVLAELSGGLDSSSIVCLADEIMATESVETPRLDTLSFYDSNDPEGDDFLHFPKVEQKRGKRGLSMDLKACGDSLPLEYSSFVAIPGLTSRTEVKSMMADIYQRRAYRVMFSGFGGDEVNAMGMNPRLFLADLLGQFRFFELSRQLVAWSLLVRKPLLQLLFGAFAQFLPAVLRCKVVPEAKLAPWMNPSFARKHKLALRQLGVVDGIWFFRPALRDSVVALAGLGKQTTHRCPSPIEGRYPFLDQTLMEFLTTVPLEQLLRPGERRSLMRRGLKDILPPEIQSRKTKVSAARWFSVALEKHWDKVEEALDGAIIGRLGYVNIDQLRVALLEVRYGKLPRYFPRLLKALSLELWLRDLERRSVFSFSALQPPSTGEDWQRKAPDLDCGRL